MVQEGLGVAGKWYREEKEVSLGAAEAKWSSIPWGPLGDEADIVQNRPSEIGCPVNPPALADGGRLSGVNFPALLGRPAQAGTLPVDSRVI